MASEDPEANRAAMRRIVPVAEDFAVLVPAHAAALWRVWGPEAARLVDEAPARAHEYRDVLPLGEIRTADLRTEGTPVLERAIAELPRDLPVRGVAIGVARGERVAAAFVPVRGRWVWLWDLERLGALVAGAPAALP